MICIRSQTSRDYDPSFITEVLLKEIQYSDTPNHDINLLKDVAVQAYLGEFAVLLPLLPFSLANGAKPQRERIRLLLPSELSSWRWSVIPRCRRRLKQNLTKPSKEDFPNITICLPFPTSRHSLKKFIGML